MDPHFHNLTLNNAMLSHIFEHLVDTDSQNKLVLGLAESWKTVNETTRAGRAGPFLGVPSE